MSSIDSAEEKLYSRPEELSEGSFLRLKQVLPLNQGCVPLNERLVNLVDFVKGVRMRYVESPASALPRLISDELSDVRLLENFDAIINLARQFQPGAFPGHCDTFRGTCFISLYLFRILADILPKLPIIPVIKDLANLFGFLANSSNFLLSRNNYLQGLDSHYFKARASLEKALAAITAFDRQRAMTIALTRQSLSQPEVKEIVQSAAETVTNEVKQSANSVVKKVSAKIVEVHNSDSEQSRPKSPARQRQVHKVAETLMKLKADPDQLPSTLRSKKPDKWIHFACEQSFDGDPCGYPTEQALYSYCRKHSQVILAEAGL